MSDFTTQTAFLAWQDGRLLRKADDTLVTAPLTVIAAAELDRRDAARLLRLLADKIEEARS
jgi:hypothetical protein